jgi:hypothetical protein
MGQRREEPPIKLTNGNIFKKRLSNLVDNKNKSHISIANKESFTQLVVAKAQELKVSPKSLLISIGAIADSDPRGKGLFHSQSFL